jgi:hypothetical protein
VKSELENQLSMINAARRDRHGYDEPRQPGLQMLVIQRRSRQSLLCRTTRMVDDHRRTGIDRVGLC